MSTTPDNADGTDDSRSEEFERFEELVKKVVTTPKPDKPREQD